MGELRDQMLGDLQLSGAKPRTQKTYLREVGNLAKYFNKSPEELGEAELKEYMLYLIYERRFSEGTRPVSSPRTTAGRVRGFTRMLLFA